MDIKKIIKEIGLFEMANNLIKVNDRNTLLSKVEETMPFPPENINQRIYQIAQWLLGFKKKKYLFFIPEIALIEEMIKQTKEKIEVIIVLPCDLDIEARERINNNLPRGVDISLLEEPYFPHSFYPENGMIVISGYLANERAMVFNDTYRLIEHYSGFFGKKVFVSYTEPVNSSRIMGWLEVSNRRLTTNWRFDYE